MALQVCSSRSLRDCIALRRNPSKLASLTYSWYSITSRHFYMISHRIVTGRPMARPSRIAWLDHSAWRDHQGSYALVWDRIAQSVIRGHVWGPQGLTCYRPSRYRIPQEIVSPLRDAFLTTKLQPHTPLSAWTMGSYRLLYGCPQSSSGLLSINYKIEKT